MIKRTLLENFKVSRYSKPMSCMKLKDDDCVVSAFLVTSKNVFIATCNCYSLWFNICDVPISGIKSSGVKGIGLKDDYVVSAFCFDDEAEYVTVFTDKGTAKRVHLRDFEMSSRGRRGLLLLREVKTNPYKILGVFAKSNKAYFGIKSGMDVMMVKNTEISICDRYKTGSSFSKGKIDDVFCKCELEFYKESVKIEDVKEGVHQISLLEIDEELKGIDDLIKEE